MMGREAERRVSVAFAALATVVAIDVGVGGLFSAQLWPGSPRRQLVQAIAVAGTAMWIAALAWRAGLALPARLAMLVWAAGVSAGWMMSGERRSVVLFAAHAALLPALGYALNRQAVRPEVPVLEAAS
jgi:hypothetical protein